MRTLIVTEFISLDGVVDSPGGGEHPHAGWTFKDVEFDEAAYEIKGREQEQTDALLLGRRSYEAFAPVWPTMREFAGYNAMPRYVVSTTRPSPTICESRPKAQLIDAQVCSASVTTPRETASVITNGSRSLPGFGRTHGA